MDGDGEVVLGGPALLGGFMVVDAVDYLFEKGAALCGGGFTVVHVENVPDLRSGIFPGG